MLSTIVKMSFTKVCEAIKIKYYIVMGFDRKICRIIAFSGKK
jgi:hypothetical protein